MPHVELLVTESPSVRRAPASSSIDRWSATVEQASEACMVLDCTGCIVALSAEAAFMFGFPDAARAIGLSLAELPLLDFSADAVALPYEEINRIPPALAINPGVQARAVLRVWTGVAPRTIDAVSTPLRDDSDVVGSLTFFTLV